MARPVSPNSTRLPGPNTRDGTASRCRAVLGVAGCVAADQAAPSHQRTCPGAHGSGYQPAATTGADGTGTPPVPPGQPGAAEVGTAPR
jgi:hypothetical protein